MLDAASSGPVYSRTPKIAQVVVEAIEYNASVFRHYELHVFAVMPNHGHLLVTPAVPLPVLLRSLKGITAKRGNVLLERTGDRFWQEESYDRVVRNSREFERLRFYVENHPVRAGIVEDSAAYQWSSAWGGRGSAFLFFLTK
ncbi:MAG TPA: transposase [Bryobacteraceae bacterium]|nr:transposase [Bryobacteraceae bacterium]